MASISNVCNLEIITQTSNDITRKKAKYKKNELKSITEEEGEKTNGTEIYTNNMFDDCYKNVGLLNSQKTSENSKIRELVFFYSLNFFGKINFNLVNNTSDPNTMFCFNSEKYNSKIDIISAVYGKNFQNNLVTFSIKNEELNYRAEGLCSNTTSKLKKIKLILFINNRLVKDDDFKENLDKRLKSLLKTNCHPFVFLTIDIAPEKIDVNFHPKKEEVRFNDYIKINEEISENLFEKVKSTTSRKLTKGKPIKSSKTKRQSSPDKDIATLPKMSEEELLREYFNNQKIRKTFKILICG